MLRCIRFGEVLMDESFRTFLICNQCQKEFVELPEFRVHLATGSCGHRLFEEEVIGLKFGAAQVSRSGKEKTYLLYNPADVQLATTEPANSTATPTDGGDDAYLDLIKIEEELLDPRWYTDIVSAQSDVDSPQHTLSNPSSANANKPMEYKDLVEAVGPYVQFKENASKRNPVGVGGKRLLTNVNNHTETIKAPKLPTKNQKTTDQPASRLLNPAVKRKLDMPPKQVQFSDTVNVKYVLNEKIRAKATTNKLPTTCKSEKIDKNEATSLKRRKTITLPMDQSCIHPDLQEQFGKRNSDPPKITGGATVARNPTARGTAITTTTKLATRSNNVACAATNVKVAISASQRDAHAHIKSIVPKPLAIQKQANGTKNLTTNSSLISKNLINSSKLNSNGVKSEANVNNKVHSAAPRPQQRTATTIPSGAAAPTVFVPAKKTATPAQVPLVSNKISNNTAAIPAPKVSDNAHQQTNDILNKLQTRGLQVKRTQPQSAIAVNTANTGQLSKTMELLQKLQSKGMNVKILNGSKQTAHAAGATVSHVNASINMPTTTARAKIASNEGNVATAIGKQTNKTILNNKLIIKKVK